MDADGGTYVGFIVAEPIFSSRLAIGDILEGRVPLHLFQPLGMWASALDRFPGGFQHVAVWKKTPSLTKWELRWFPIRRIAGFLKVEGRRRDEAVDIGHSPLVVYAYVQGLSVRKGHL